MIFLILVVLLVTFISFGFYKANELRHIQIISTVTIKNTQSNVFNMVKFLQKFPKWSPFLAEDTEQKYKIKGTDGTVGAQYHWEGNNGKDLGYQEIVKINDGKFIGMQCDIQKPFKAKPTFDYYFTETKKGIEVKQDFNLKSGIIDAFFMWIFGAKEEMQKTNTLGLQLLKKALEK